MRKKKSSFFVKFFSVAIILATFLVVRYWYINQFNLPSRSKGFLNSSSIDISSEIQGISAKAFFNEGDFVKKGDVLHQLDPAYLEAMRKKVEKEYILSKEEANLAKFQEEIALQDYVDVRKKHEENESSKQIEQKLKVLEEKQLINKIAIIKIEALEANLDLIDRQIDKLTICSPCDGCITKKWIVDNEYVQIGQPIFTICDTQNLWVELNLKETALKNVKIDDIYKIIIPAFSDKSIYGKVFFVGTSQEKNIFEKNIVPVKLSIEASKEELAQENVVLRPGMSANVNIKS